jgi:hypothetical protein
MRDFTNFLFALALGLLIIVTSVYFWNFEDTVIAALAFIIAKLLLRDLEKSNTNENNKK